MYVRNFKIITLVLLVVCTAGCANFNGFKMLAPETFGLSQVAQNIYVEASAEQVTRDKIQEVVARAEKSVEKAYGGVNSRPVIIVCMSRECYGTFGGSKNTVGGSFVFINRLLLAPEGANWHFIAHEWSHRELFSRLSLRAWWQIPVWFDEGLAVAISEAPKHSEEHWQYLVSNNIQRPGREQLLTLKTLKQWNGAIHQYGEDGNIERKAKGEVLIHPVYTAAGQELRPWVAHVGSTGLLALIDRLNDGADFESAYLTANIAVERDAPQATLAPRPSP